MQLKKAVIRNKLALASSALLLASPVMPTIAAEKHQFLDTIKQHKFTRLLSDALDDSAIGISRLSYVEEGRLRVDKTQALIDKEITENNIVTANLVYDTMSGASPNGRIYSVEGEPYIPGGGGGGGGNITFTTASGNANTVAGGSGGAIATWKTAFTDQRKALNAEWEHRFLPTFSSILGSGFSVENDYQSFSFSGKLSLEINQRRTTLTAGAAVSNDTVSPFGGVPTGASELVCYEKSGLFLPGWSDLNCDNKAATFKPGNKISNDYLVGITQVWNRRTLMQLNFSLSSENGYLTDPYKQVSVYNSVSASEVTVLYEKRPNTRQRKSLFYKIVHLPTNYIALHFSYRYYWDDWDVTSDTFNARARINLGPYFYFQLHGRLHWQSAAKFFRPYIGGDSGSRYYSENRPVLVSADSRLSELTATTFGAKLGFIINKSNNFSVRLEQMQQEYKNNLLPTMNTLIIQVNLNHKF